jgi:hypothetical protein
MNLVAVSPRHPLSVTGLSSLVAAAVLLGACQQPSSSASGQSSAYPQTMGGDVDTKRERRCCVHAGKNNNR